MLLRRFVAHQAVVQPSTSRSTSHVPALVCGARCMSRFSAETFTGASSHSSFSATAAPVQPPVSQVLPPPEKSWSQRWDAVQSVAAMTPSYFSSVLQSRYTRAPGTTAAPFRFSAAMALLRRVSYVNALYTRLGFATQHASVTVTEGDRKALSSLFQTLRGPRRLTTASSVEDSALLQSKDGNKNSGNGSKKGGDGNNKNNNKDSSEGGGEGEEEKPEDWIVPRTCLFVLLMIILTVVLYQLSRPSGKHTGWASLNKHAGEIKEVALYENYVQVYLDEAKVYLGLVSDHDTQRHIDELAANYRAARAKAIQEEQQQQQQQQQLEVEKQKEKKKTTDGKQQQSVEEASSSPMSFLKKKPSAADKPEDLDVTMKGRPLAETALVGVGVFAWVVPFIFFPVFVMFLSQYIGKSMSYAVEATKGKSKVKEMIFRVEQSSTTRFRDIAGMKEPKKEITEIVDFLRHPERYTKLGAKIPTGAILLGPPGTGKTLLAKAVAGESGVGFIPAIGSDFVELYVGMGALRVRQLFKEARKQRCIIYIDEIDAIGLKRQGAGHGEKQEQEQTLNELLTQLDGFSTGKRGDVMVLASSNVAQEALDPALIRPGRFDRIIHVDTPVISERIDIFKVHLSKLKLTSDAAKQGEEAAQTQLPSQDAEAAAEAASTSSAKEEEEDKKEEKTSENASAVDAAAVVEKEAPSTPTDDNASQKKSTAATTSAGSSLILSQVEAEKKAFEAEDVSTATTSAGASKSATVSGHDAHDFDFRALLMQKSDAERAMIDVYAERMSNLCPGFVGADIANVCNEGAILAAREGADHVDISHLERSIDRVLAGIEHRSRAMSDFEKNVVAHHEAGHAVAGWFLNRADPLMKVSIVPRGGSALGYAQYLPNENYTRTAKEIRDSISVTLGGRVAEQIFFNHLSTGASDDLRKVGRMAYQYVASFSPGSVYPAPGTNSTRLVKPFGVNKSNDFDRRAKALVDDVYADTVKLLTEHKDDMKKLADHLLKHELLTYADVVQYLGTRSTRQTDKRKGV